MIVLDMEQGTEEWLAARLGIPTASNFKKLFTATGKPSTSAETYFYELLAERLTGKPSNEYTNEWMVRGTELEPEARSTYEFIHDVQVQQIGFVYLDDRRHVGCSPDGLIGDEGLIEIKAPKASTHVKYLLDGKVPSDYVPQVQGQLWITGRKFCDFVSYHPDCDPFIVRVDRDDDYIAGLAAEVEKLAKKLDAAMAKLNKQKEAA